MRPIQFRGKRKDNNEWVYGSLHDSICFTNKLIRVYNYNDVGDLEPTDYDVIPETVGQVIGVRDKNKLDVYEGDKIINETFNTKGIVTWEPNILGWVLMDMDGKTYTDGKMIWNGDVKIIGNKFDGE